jgi:hypothetical protein
MARMVYGVSRTTVYVQTAIAVDDALGKTGRRDGAAARQRSRELTIEVTRVPHAVEADVAPNPLG